MAIPKTIQQKLDEGRQYRRIDVKNLEIRSDNDGEMIVEGYATTFNEPYELYRYGSYIVREQVDAHAFDGADMGDVIMQYDHQGRVFARNSNGTLTLTVDNHGLKIRADLGGTELGRQLYEEIKGGYTDKMSFGFTVEKDKREEKTDRDSGVVTVLRTITGIRKLYDVSAVSIPANNATEISARNYGEGVIAELEEERRRQREARERQKRKIKILLEV